jgi:hypothetical protein
VYVFVDFTWRYITTPHSMGVFSQLISDRHVNIATSQLFTGYFLLFLVYGTILARRRCAWAGGTPLQPDPVLERERHPISTWGSTILEVPWWHYALLAFVDLEANYLFTLGMQVSCGGIFMRVCATTM